MAAAARRAKAHKSYRDMCQRRINDFSRKSLREERRAHDCEEKARSLRKDIRRRLSQRQMTSSVSGKVEKGINAFKIGIAYPN